MVDLDHKETNPNDIALFAWILGCVIEYNKEPGFFAKIKSWSPEQAEWHRKVAMKFAEINTDLLGQGGEDRDYILGKEGENP
jgi:hypothetical protein